MACNGPVLPLYGVLTIIDIAHCQPKYREDAQCPEGLQATHSMQRQGSPASLTFT